MFRAALQPQEWIDTKLRIATQESLRAKHGLDEAFHGTTSDFKVIVILPRSIHHVSCWLRNVAEIVMSSQLVL